MIDKGYLLGERYRILDTLGEGGMANVYLAEDIILQQKVAVKMLRMDLLKDKQTLLRFKREALATSALSHPNIVSVLDVSTDDGQPYIVMEYVDGPDLKDYIKAHSPLPIHEVIRIMDQILSAVGLAHRHNVIHRDLKPQNILMDQRGNIKIADFGIAVALNQSSVTQTNSVMGSVHYMSPEQTRGGMATKQSDIYSLGIILYELLTGQVPFAGDTAMAVALKHAQEAIPSIRKNHPNVPQALENVVLKATSKEPQDRYNSAEEMREDLDSSLDPARANEPTFVPPHLINNDETIILPGFKADKADPANSEQASTNEETADDTVQPTNQPTRRQRFISSLKRHKWWWLFTAIIGVLIVAIMAFALSEDRNDWAQVPDVANMTETAASAQLEKAGFTIGRIRAKHSSKIKKGRVIKTQPAAGEAASKGKSVDLIISSGPVKVTMPDVVDMQYQPAKRKLAKVGLKVKRKNIYSDSIDSGIVISQSVTSDKKVAKGTVITLKVSKGQEEDPEENMVTLKDLTNYSQKSAQDYADENDLNLVVKKDYSDSVEKGLVISMDPGAGTHVQKGSTLTITVSKGAEKTSKTITKNFTVTYDDPDDNSSSSSSSTSSSSSSSTSQGNHVQIYIEDENHSIDNIYRDLYIKKDTDFSIPLTLKDGQSGRIKVVRDGKTVMNEKVSN